MKLLVLILLIVTNLSTSQASVEIVITGENAQKLKEGMELVAEPIGNGRIQITNLMCETYYSDVTECSFEGKFKEDGEALTIEASHEETHLIGRTLYPYLVENYRTPIKASKVICEIDEDKCYLIK